MIQSQRKNKIGCTEYRTADFNLNKLHILSKIEEYTEDKLGIPILRPFSEIELPTQMLRFSKAISQKRHDLIVHFYETDRAFARILHAPSKYAEILKRFDCVISPDFSQHLDMPAFIRYQNSWWNKALGVYWQALGINVIPNVAWSRPDSYEYAFAGIPKQSVIAINCSAIKGNPMSKYFWQKGYEAAITILNPTLIIRYGDIMPGEDTGRSIFFENENLKKLRHGR